MESKQRIVIKTKSLWQPFPRYGLVEHAAERGTVDCNGLHTKADDPTGKLVHDDQNPVTPQQDRFRPEQVQAPETVRGVPQEREPRRTVLLALGSIVCSQNPADHILI